MKTKIIEKWQSKFNKGYRCLAECQNCGKPFEDILYRVEKGNRKYCSRECFFATQVTWTANDEKYLIDNYSLMSITQLAKELDRTEIAIYRKAYMLGIKKPRVNMNVNILSERERGLLAGCIDCDGHLGFYRRKKSWIAQAGVSNTDYNFMLTLKAIVGAGSITNVRTPNGQPFFQFCLTTNGLRRLLPQLQLIRKEPQRQLLIKALNLLGDHSGGKRPHDEWLEEIYQEMKVLNKRG